MDLLIVIQFDNSESLTRCESCESCKIFTTCKHITCLIAAIAPFHTILSVERKGAFVGTIESNVSRHTFLNIKYKITKKLNLLITIAIYIFFIIVLKLFLTYFKGKIVYLTLAFVVLGIPEVTNTTPIDSSKLKEKKK